MWPYVCQFVEKLFKETIEPAIKEANSHLSTFTFSKVDLGDKVWYALKCLQLSQKLCTFNFNKDTHVTAHLCIKLNLKKNNNFNAAGIVLFVLLD